MSNPNQLAGNPEQETFAHQEIVQFNDGEMALGFRTPGDQLPLGEESNHKYASHFDINDMALIATESGNTYALADGMVINKNRQTAYELPKDTINVTIGKPCEIPGVGTTTAVESVLLRWKVATPGSTMADHQVDAPSPFKALQEEIEAHHSSQS